MIFRNDEEPPKYTKVTHDDLDDADKDRHRAELLKLPFAMALKHPMHYCDFQQPRLLGRLRTASHGFSASAKAGAGQPYKGLKGLILKPF